MMNIKKVRELVKKKGVDIRVGRKKEDMIRDYQMIEGYSPCFHTKDSCAKADKGAEIDGEATYCIKKQPSLLR
jgi:hypothetical protein